MTAFMVFIPGTTANYTVYANSRADAIAEALAFHGLTRAPMGTSAVPFEHPFNTPPVQLPNAA